MSVPPRRVVAALTATMLTAVLAASAAPLDALPFFDRGPYRKGDPVTVTGQVTDAAGRPLDGATVLLEVSRRAFRISRLGRETTGILRLPATADAAGNFRLDWRWDPYYNQFALLVALPVREAGHDTHEIFHRQDITGLMLSGGAVRASLALADTTAYRALSDFLASLASDDEKRVYQDMGRPDRIDTGQAAYDPDRTWWYFAAGKAYRFRDGGLDQVVHFEPVPEP